MPDVEAFATLNLADEQCQEPACGLPRVKRYKACWFHLQDGLGAHERAWLACQRQRSTPERWGADPVDSIECVDCGLVFPSWWGQPRRKRCLGCYEADQLNKRAQANYGMGEGEYMRLLYWQGGRCWICRKFPRARALAVDHDHYTGAVRGLLCASQNRGCNNALLGLIPQGQPGLDMIDRMRGYLTDPPYRRFKDLEEHS